MRSLAGVVLTVATALFAGEVRAFAQELGRGAGSSEPQEASTQLSDDAAVDPSQRRVRWEDGLRIDLMKKRLRLKVGGRYRNDWFWYEEDDDLAAAEYSVEDSTLSRANLYVSGAFAEKLSFKVQWQFTEGESEVNDVHVSISDLPAVGNLKIGHFKEPFGLEQLTSTNSITFMERSLPHALSPGRNSGVMIHDTALRDRATWAVGVFRDFGFSEDIGTDDPGYSVTARVTGLPLYLQEGRRLFHVGFAGSYREPDNSVRFRQRPESREAPKFLDTGDLDVANDVRLGAEVACVYGALSLQAEYMYARVAQEDPRSAWEIAQVYAPLVRDGLETRRNSARTLLENAAAGALADLAPLELAQVYAPVIRGGLETRRNFVRTLLENAAASDFGDLDFSGYYVQASWFLTGEVRPYSKKKGTFGGVQPKRNFGLRRGRRGPGAWEATLRYSHLDLNDRLVRGGEEDNLSVGVNWYLNPNMRVMVNYVRADIERDTFSGELDAVQTRFQVNF